MGTVCPVSGGEVKILQRPKRFWQSETSEESGSHFVNCVLSSEENTHQPKLNRLLMHEYIIKWTMTLEVQECLLIDGCKGVKRPRLRGRRLGFCTRAGLQHSVSSHQTLGSRFLICRREGKANIPAYWAGVKCWVMNLDKPETLVL